MDITLSVRDMFGVVAGSGYGCPKNILHWKGIQESILDLCAIVSVHFVIADGIVAMEGNGPLNGTPRPLHSSTWLEKSKIPPRLPFRSSRSSAIFVHYERCLLGLA